MRAAVCYEFGQPLVIDEIELDPPKLGEVRVRVTACGICHSDLHRLRGERGGALPIVAGHEVAGIVEELGPGASGVEPGDRVIVSLLRSCGRCFFCQTGAPHHCEHVFPLQTETRLHTRDGVPIVQGVNVGGFAEQVVVDQSQIVKVPDGLPMESVALLACGVITGFGAVVNTANVPAGSSVVVIGTGGVGMNAIQGARLSGAYPIVAVDVLDGKLEDAQGFGSTHGVNATRADAVEAVRAITGPRGADYVFVTVGSAQAAALGLNLVREAGSLVLVGMPPTGVDLPLPVFETVFRSVKILGSKMGSTRLSVDVPRLLDLYQAGHLQLDELITERYPLERINEAIASVERGEALRHVIVM
jgi:Zn-dependent alcohol dehydrogenase